MNWIDDRAILALKPPPFLIEDVIPERAVVALVGEPGLGKTFIALDIAFTLASGRAWHGFGSRQRSVAYVIAEGLGGLPHRVAAWRSVHGYAPLQPIGVSFWPDAIQLASPVAVQQFTMSLAELPQPPGLIVIDTLARCFVGKDENHARDMGEFVRGVDALRSTGASVMVVHHTGHLKTRERGSTALRGAVDTLLIAERANGAAIALRCEKQREAEAFDPIGLKLRSVELESGSSAVVDEHESALVAAATSAKWTAAVALLDAKPMPFAEWLAASKMSKAAFCRLLRAAKASGEVEMVGQVYRRKES